MSSILGCTQANHLPASKRNFCMHSKNCWKKILQGNHEEKNWAGGFFYQGAIFDVKKKKPRKNSRISYRPQKKLLHSLKKITQPLHPPPPTPQKIMVRPLLVLSMGISGSGNETGEWWNDNTEENAFIFPQSHTTAPFATNKKPASSLHFEWQEQQQKSLIYSSLLAGRVLVYTKSKEK